MPLLPFWALNVIVALLSMQGQKALRFHEQFNHLYFLSKLSYVLILRLLWTSKEDFSENSL